jgi:hypothetical protein
MEDLEAPVQAMIDATNSGHDRGFLEAFADDAVLVDWGRTFAGKSEISRWNDNENIGTRSHLKVIDAQRDGARTVVSVEVTGNGYNGSSTFTFDTADGLITRLFIA